MVEKQCTHTHTHTQTITQKQFTPQSLLKPHNISIWGVTDFDNIKKGKSPLPWGGASHNDTL